MQDMTATYSPEDNKLRLYSATRLDSETYARVKARGFRWAPKQGFFVAPMWTPEREDLLIELAGEIGDEDTSLAERAEQRAERFQDYKEKRTADAESAHAAVHSICDGIPLGQPILVGHHSERRARKDAERIENGMRKAVKMWDTAEYWKRRAAGAIRHAKYKERPDVRARRIKGLEADKRKQERHIEACRRRERFWNGEMKLKRDGQPFILAITEENRGLIHHCLGNIPDLSGHAVEVDGHRFSDYDLTMPAEKRYTHLKYPELSIEEIRAARLKSIQASIVGRAARWIAHYDNRLAYERAMLAEEGGTVADKTGPEVGGACRCWASPYRFQDGWSFIHKVNRVSVTVHHTYQQGGRKFAQTIPFDKLHAVMTKAEVEAAEASGKLRRDPDGVGFFLLSTEPPPTPAPKTAPTPDPAKEMREALRAGVQVVSAPQLFPTPHGLAARVIELADVDDKALRVLEPSAGTGRLLSALYTVTDHCEVVAVEVNPGLANRLKESFPGSGVEIHCADFLTCNGDLGKFDRIVMNPPFENGADIKHIQHARTFLKEGGKLVAICAAGPRQREAFVFSGEADLWEDLPAGTFADEGTNVNAALIVIQN